ncbi:MAG: pyridoxal 5'-phosphate synthase glutaminase subunit PdxT [Symbiobacteriia bacterium]
MRVGVLAMQGAFREHVRALQALGADPLEVRRPDHLEGLAGLILPGGESTTIGQLIQDFGLDPAIRALAAAGKPIYGTCAGMILLAEDIAGSDQYRLGLMHMRAQRNAFGRQQESFEAALAIPAVGEDPVHAVFIRAPYIEAVWGGCEALATYEGKIVMARQGPLLATAFHPELTDDLQVHRYFLDMVRAAQI